jgi:hypothetical protein
MPFPNLKPTSRAFDAGDYPIKTFQSQSGVETRILYGSRRTGAQLSLSFDNISDTDANAFVTHFDETKGTYSTFSLAGNTTSGWTPGTINAGTGNNWRYSGPPEISSVRPGRSSVTVKLVAVL